jgi:hypothetical protein
LSANFNQKICKQRGKVENQLQKKEINQLPWGIGPQFRPENPRIKGIVQNDGTAVEKRLCKGLFGLTTREIFDGGFFA